MLNLFSSSSFVSCQFLVLESPLSQVIFLKNCNKIPNLKAFSYDHKGFELFSKMSLESSWAF